MALATNSSLPPPLSSFPFFLDLSLFHGFLYAILGEINYRPFTIVQRLSDESVLIFFFLDKYESVLIYVSILQKSGNFYNIASYFGFFILFISNRIL